MIRPVFLLASAVGLGMIYFGAKNLLPYLRKKTSVGFHLDNGAKTFQLKSSGLYAICLVGAKHIILKKNSRISIVDQAGKNIELKTPTLKIRHTYGVEFLNFTINNPGTFTLQVENSEKIIAKKTMLPFRRLFQSKVSPGKLKLLIHRTVPAWKFGLSILSLVLGVNITGWGVILTFSLDKFL